MHVYMISTMFIVGNKKKSKKCWTCVCRHIWHFLWTGVALPLFAYNLLWLLEQLNHVKIGTVAGYDGTHTAFIDHFGTRTKVCLLYKFNQILHLCQLPLQFWHQGKTERVLLICVWSTMYYIKSNRFLIKKLRFS